MTANAAPTPSNPLGARFVATWQQDCSSWAVERHEPGTTPASAEVYVDGLPTRSPSMPKLARHALRGLAAELEGLGTA